MVRADFLNAGRSYPTVANGDQIIGRDLIENKWYNVQWQPKQIDVPISHEVRVRFTDNTAHTFPGGTRLRDVNASLAFPFINKTWRQIKFVANMSWDEYIMHVDCGRTSHSLCDGAMRRLAESDKNAGKIKDEKTFDHSLSTPIIIVTTVSFLALLSLMSLIIFKNKNRHGY